MALLKIHVHQLKSETIIPSLARQPHVQCTIHGQHINLRPILYSYVK